MRPIVGQAIHYAAKVYRETTPWAPGELEEKLAANQRKVINLDHERALAEDVARTENTPEAWMHFQSELCAIEARAAEAEKADTMAMLLADEGELACKPGIIMGARLRAGAREGSEDEADYEVDLRVFAVGDFSNVPYGGPPLIACHWFWPA